MEVQFMLEEMVDVVCECEREGGEGGEVLGAWSELRERRERETQAAADQKLYPVQWEAGGRITASKSGEVGGSIGGTNGAIAESKRPAKDPQRIVKGTGKPAINRLQEKGSIGGTNSAIAESKRPPKDTHRIVQKTQKPATDRHHEKNSIGGMNRKGNTGTDVKFAANLITNSLRLSAVELAEYKIVHGGLRKFMADTKSSKIAASDLSIDKGRLSQFLCGTLRTKAEVRRTVAAVAEALEGR
jgi:hypothetical protein